MECKLIKELVERESGISNLAKKSRIRSLTNYRFVYFALCRKFVPQASLHKIALTVGLKNHATTINGIEKFEQLKGSKYFSEYYRCYLNLSSGLKRDKGLEYELSFKSVDEVKDYFRVNEILKTAKTHEIITKLQNRIVEINKNNK